MCGISGIIDFKDKADIIAVKKSIAAMHYRGADAQDYFEDDVATLGHLRLSIIDLNPRSNQPFVSACGRYIIVFNGEVYNFKQLRHQMELAGFQFRTASDTEVLLEGFIMYGFDVLIQLTGLWSFVIWDKLHQKAFMARDRFGEKPFYFQYVDNNRFAFASNLAGLKPLVKGKLEINPDGVRQLFNYDYILGDTCIYKTIKKIPPGHYAWLKADSFEIQPYWQLDYRTKHHLPYDELKKQVRQRMVESVEQALISDVPVGVFLSGGMNSGVLTGIASSIKKDITAFTMTVPGNADYNEENNAAKVANHCGIEHYKLPFNESSIALLPEILATIEPLADNALIPNLYVAKYAGHQLRVMLSGDGGDELFGGYGIPLSFQNTESKSNVFTDRVVRKLIEKPFTIGYKSVVKRLDTSRMIKWAKPETFYRNGFLPYDLQKKIFNESIWSENESVVDFFKRAKAFSGNLPDAILWTGIQTAMTNNALFKMDSANMLFSVEGRSPFLNHKIAELTTGATINELMPNGIDKQMLAEIGEEFIPKQVLYNKQKGYAIPIDDFLNKRWLKSLEQMAYEGLSSDAGIIDPIGVQQIIALFRETGNHRLAKLLYAILVFEIWLRVFHLEMDTKEVADKYLL